MARLSPQPPPKGPSRTLKKRLGLFVSLLGLLVFLLGATPQAFGLDRSPVVGFIQITVFSLGLGLLGLGGYFTLDALWRDTPKNIPADIGIRLAGTGYVIALTSGLADVFGLGTRPLPSVPFFGYWQGAGVLIGQLIMIIGFVMFSPYWARRPQANKQKKRR
ncbi:MAG: hypothetical protein KF821_06825 [Anaerolineales bacterium]|jgi:hypothetical protein|nr:hypothetical protein [Anaerolineales bacterium]MBX3005526.1 hypothetical protein [Anaerolineales bacterium]